jgi:hypothetical protein
MHTIETNEIRELTAAELEEVTGGQKAEAQILQSAALNIDAGIKVAVDL